MDPSSFYLLCHSQCGLDTVSYKTATTVRDVTVNRRRGTDFSGMLLYLKRKKGREEGGRKEGREKKRIRKMRREKREGGMEGERKIDVLHHISPVISSHDYL